MNGLPEGGIGILTRFWVLLLMYSGIETKRKSHDRVAVVPILISEGDVDRAIGVDESRDEGCGG